MLLEYVRVLFVSLLYPLVGSGLFSASFLKSMFFYVFDPTEMQLK